MSREIKFRGKCQISGDLVFGDLIHGVGAKSKNVYILPNRINLAVIKHCDPLDGVKVDPETVGQYTGLKDKNGVEIYEGDIVSAWSEGYNHKGEIRWRFEGQPSIIIYPAFSNQNFWKLHGERGNGNAFSDNKTDDGVEIIGNIYENPELLHP